jgi:3-oxoacyl-[acyl-carrier-protein] synthase-3
MESDTPRIGPFVYGSNGSGANNLLVPAGGLRLPCSEQTAVATEDAHGNVRSANNLFMDGGEIFNFTLSCASSSVDRLLQKAGLDLNAIDLFVFHQTNTYTLQHLRKRLKIPEEKFVISMSHCGNTVSSTIPIALKDAMDSGRVPSGSTVMLVGFGVGYSWGATLLRTL